MHSVLSNQVSSKSWVTDSGSFWYITEYKEVLGSISEEVNDEVTIGDNSTHSVKGIGYCTLKLKSVISLHLKGVLYVPRIKRNLIFVTPPEDDEHKVAFMDGKVMTWSKNSSFKKSKLIGQRKGYLYELNTEPIQVLIHEVVDINEVWHRRLGHLNFKALSTMEKMVTGLPKLNKDHSSIWKGCALGKNTKSPFQNSTRKTNNVLELAHLDLCEPMFVPSLGGFWFNILFTDDCSRKTWIYFLKCKNQKKSLRDLKNSNP